MPGPKLTEAQRKEVTLLAALVGVGLVAVYGWVVHPHAGALRAAQSYERSLQDYAKTNAAVNVALRREQRLLEELSQEHEQLSARVFEPADAQDLLGRLESYCVNNACSLTSVTSLDSREAYGATIVPMTTAVSVNGTYDGIIGLVDTLTARPQAVVIESLRMTVLQASSEQIRCSIVFTIYVSSTEGRSS